MCEWTLNDIPGMFHDDPWNNFSWNLKGACINLHEEQMWKGKWTKKDRAWIAIFKIEWNSLPLNCNLLWSTGRSTFTICVHLRHDHICVGKRSRNTTTQLWKSVNQRRISLPKIKLFEFDLTPTCTRNIYFLPIIIRKLSIASLAIFSLASPFLTIIYTIFILRLFLIFLFLSEL